jgi:hypothetical protein
VFAQTLAAAEYPLRSAHIRPIWNSRALSSKGRNRPPERIERRKTLCNRTQLTSRDSSNDFFYNFLGGAYFCLAVNPAAEFLFGNQRSIFPPKPNQTECDRFAFNSEWRCSVTNKISQRIRLTELPRILPLVRHRDDMVVYHVETLAVPHLPSSCPHRWTPCSSSHLLASRK